MLIPYGYGTEYRTVESVAATLIVHHHPEYVRRIIPWLESKAGEIGVGGGWRLTQPVKPGAAPEGMSFHQDQKYNDGFVGACAVDLVARNPNAGGVHLTVRWAQVLPQGSAAAKLWGLHCNVNGSTQEPWHMQPIEIDGWQSWVNAGRPAPKAGYSLPTDPKPGVDVNWNPTTTTIASIKTAPPTADVLAGKFNDWAVISLIKSFEREAGLPVTGKWSQALGEAINETLDALA